MHVVTNGTQIWNNSPTWPKFDGHLWFRLVYFQVTYIHHIYWFVCRDIASAYLIVFLGWSLENIVMS